MNAAAISTLRALKSSAVIVLLLMQLNGQPTRARLIAEMLDMDYETVRRHLRALAHLGIVSESPTGYILLQGGIQLVLSADESAEIPRRFTAAATALDLNSSSSSSKTAIGKSDDSSVKPPEKRGNSALPLTEKRGNSALPPTEREKTALETLASLGISASYPQVIHMVRQNLWITSDYIEAQANRLINEKRYTTGLLLHVLKSGDPIPLTQEQRAEANRKQSYKKYTSGDYND